METQSSKFFLRSNSFKIFFIIATVLYVALLFWVVQKQFAVAEEMPKIYEIDQKTKNITSVVRTGMYISTFSKFSFIRNEFLLDGIVWFRFPAGTETLKTIEKFSFYFSFLIGSNIQYRSKPIIKYIGQDVLVSYSIQTDFKAHLNFKKFPLEDHKLNILIQNQSVTPNELCFESSKDDFLINPETLVPYQYKTRNITVKTGYIKSTLNKLDPQMECQTPCVLYSIDFENLGTREVSTLYFPMFVLFLIGLLSLLIDITDSRRLGLIAASVPSLVLFRLVIDNLSPKVSYSMQIDYIFSLFISLSLFILLFQAAVTFALSHDAEHDTESKAKLYKRLSITSDVLFYVTLIIFAGMLTFICL
jgi:hypothetical protein